MAKTFLFLPFFFRFEYFWRFAFFFAFLFWTFLFLFSQIGGQSVSGGTIEHIPFYGRVLRGGKRGWGVEWEE